MYSVENLFHLISMLLGSPMGRENLQPLQLACYPRCAGLTGNFAMHQSATTSAFSGTRMRAIDERNSSDFLEERHHTAPQGHD